MNLVLPYPPSANRYWRHFRGRTVVSAEARTYKRTVAVLARSGGRRGVFAGPVAIRVLLRPTKPLRPGKGRLRSIDLDNCLKIVIDALQGVAFENDSQVDELYALRGEAVPGGALEVQVTQV